MIRSALEIARDAFALGLFGGAIYAWSAIAQHVLLR